MDEDLISVVDLANQHGKRKQTIFKILKRLNIETIKQKNSGSRGQSIAYITNKESRLVQAELASSLQSEGGEEDTLEPVLGMILTEQGVFYLLLLEPEHDPRRFKVGFTVNLSERLRTLRCSAPFTRVVRTWPCKGLWEKTAIECVTDGCERLHTEVFRAESIDTVITKCSNFFDLMPKLPV